MQEVVPRCAQVVEEVLLVLVVARDGIVCGAGDISVGGLLRGGWDAR